jgi:uncharacterized protein
MYNKNAGEDVRRYFMSEYGNIYETLREFAAGVPVIDTHDHTYRCGPAWNDPLHSIVCSYYELDLRSVLSPEQISYVKDVSIPLEKRWKVFEPGWKGSRFAGYGRCVARAIKHFYGADELSFEVLQRISNNTQRLSDDSFVEAVLDEAGIETRLQDLGHITDSERITEQVLDGSFRLSPRSRIVIPLPRYHKILSYTDLQSNAAPLGFSVTSLDEYLWCCRKIFEGYRDFGAAAFKDQSAYRRGLDYTNPAKEQAEAVFNKIAADPRYAAKCPEETKPLDDWLFNQFMRIAAEFDLPVQIHTGHISGAHNQIRKVSAVELAAVIHLHRDVRFDLLHANWPYMDDILYLAKSYPNVRVNFCWANIIDPMYCRDMFARIISSVPHAKLHAYGSDFTGIIEQAWAHLEMTRDNLCGALEYLIKTGYLGIEESKEIIWDMFYNNPKTFFKL